VHVRPSVAIDQAEEGENSLQLPAFVERWLLNKKVNPKGFLCTQEQEPFS
jgi:hypothetical protein